MFRPVKIVLFFSLSALLFSGCEEAASPPPAKVPPVAAALRTPEEAVAAAKEMVTALNPLEKLSVSKGEGASLSAKETALKTRFLLLAGYKTLEVNTEVQPVSETDINNGSTWLITFSREEVTDTALLMVAEFAEPPGDVKDRETVSDALDVISLGTGGFASLNVMVEKGENASESAKKIAVKSTIVNLSGYPASTAATTVSLLDTGVWSITVEKGKASETRSIGGVHFFERADPNVTAVLKAKAKIVEASPIPGLSIPGGAEGSLSAKTSAIKTYIYTLAGYVTLGVATSVDPVSDTATGDGSFWLISLGKGSADDTALLSVSRFTGTAEDEANSVSVADAVDIVGKATADFTEFSITLKDAGSASETTRKNALKSAFLLLPGFIATGVSLEIEKGPGDSWLLYFSKGGATRSETLTTVLYVDQNERDISAVAAAKEKIAVTAPFKVIQVINGNKASLDSKKARIKSSILILTGYNTLGVDTTVLPFAESDIGDGSSWIIALEKGKAQDLIIIKVLQFLPSS